MDKTGFIVECVAVLPHGPETTIDEDSLAQGKPSEEVTRTVVDCFSRITAVARQRNTSTMLVIIVLPVSPPDRSKQENGEGTDELRDMFDPDNDD